MFFDHRGEHLQSVRVVLSSIIAPLQHMVNYPFKLFSSLQTEFSSRERLLTENTQLRAEQLVLRAQLQKYLATEKENAELKNIHSAATKFHSPFLIAQLLAVADNLFANQAVIDKGSGHRIYIGQPVLDARGVFGQVIEVNPLTSRILLITDPHSAIPVIDTRSSIRGIAIGGGSTGLLFLQNVPETADIKPGDVLITSGLGGVFPAGYPVGTVTSISPAANTLFMQVKVEPAALLNSSRLLMLVWPEQAIPKEEINAVKGINK